ncbi:hypothetical protein CBR_g54927 [Chara braunii]|uniref:Uncharacterized protein n=1 Tax=Chara braunii TaxID=69332 RepID=A0A388JPV9_CHABU|nr:hypothetical protein CBR_g54927 [Chara braunii]|eukprot:GBG59825.1 hypothetical protein CBR_g54927 [Chara braunii]
MDRVRLKQMIQDCYLGGILPKGLISDHADQIERGDDYVKVNISPEAYETQLEWLKEHSVAIFFGQESDSFAVGLKKKIIRVYENTWIGSPMLGPKPRRGLFKNEGRNLISYITSTKEVANYLLSKREDEIELDGVMHKLSFKPWMIELLELQYWRETNKYPFFWIRCLQLPIAVMPMIEEAVEKAFGRVIKTYPFTKRPNEPELHNVRFDLEPSAMHRYTPYLIIGIPDGKDTQVTVEVACATTDWCPICKQYFHSEDDPDCPGRKRVQRSNIEEKEKDFPDDYEKWLEEKEKEKEREREIEEERERERQQEEANEREREMEKQREEEKRRKKERRLEDERERQRMEEMEMERKRAREREKERERQKEVERLGEREMELEKERERERDIELQRERDYRKEWSRDDERRDESERRLGSDVEESPYLEKGGGIGKRGGRERERSPTPRTIREHSSTLSQPLSHAGQDLSIEKRGRELSPHSVGVPCYGSIPVDMNGDPSEDEEGEARMPLSEEVGLLTDGYSLETDLEEQMMDPLMSELVVSSQSRLVEEKLNAGEALPQENSWIRAPTIEEKFWRVLGPDL